jgi:hypothetical protein
MPGERQASSHTRALIASTQSILDMLGPIRPSDQEMALSGRSPNLPNVTLRDLLDRSDYTQMSPAISERMTAVVGRQICEFRQYSMRHFGKLASQLRSLSHSGLSDVEVESQLIQVYETRYEGFLDEVRRLLVRSIVRRSHEADHRNIRGGFGDVSPPPPTQS